MLEIYVDGDGCPVKEDVYRIAKRYDLNVHMVCNSPQRLPKATWIKPIIVGSHFDAVDDWIAEHATKDDIVVTNDILLAARCIKLEARVIDPRGKILDEDNIGEALANRELMAHLRLTGSLQTGPKPMGSKHRSQFAANFDSLINATKRGKR